jgi:hypothetical protein
MLTLAPDLDLQIFDESLQQLTWDLEVFLRSLESTRVCGDLDEYRKKLDRAVGLVCEVRLQLEALRLRAHKISTPCQTLNAKTPDGPE